MYRSIRSGSRGLAVVGVLFFMASLVPAASAVVVHKPNGRFLSLAPHKGIRPASIRGSVAAQNQATAPSSNGTLSYHSGPVLHSSDPYLIFWVPGSETMSSSTESLLKRYFTDVAGDGGGSSNVYGVNRQFTDGSGYADYSQTFSSSSQAIVDTHAYPTRDTTNCPDVSASYPTCITDAQLQTEIERLIAADGLPTGTGANAPIYFVVLPTDVNECSDSADCADNVFCAYHSNLSDGGNQVLYAAIPTLLAATDPKGCQYDNQTAVQEPNGDQIGDVTIKSLSHEDNETITDPLGTGWWNTTTGNEDGDECNFWGSTVDPAKDSNPNAFAPALGGSASAGTLYDQVINGNQYYIQSEWSNGDSNCELRPTTGTITPSFTEPTGPNVVGSSLSFNPAASTSTNTISSETWNFGDGSTSFHGGGPASVSHAYSSAGTYPVKLTLVDNRGNSKSVSESVTVSSKPVPSFTFSPSTPAAGSPVNFDGTSSSDPDAGVTINSYSWSFGDGATGSGSTPSHTYTIAGIYTVSLTVTNNVGLSNTTSKSVTVSADESPTAAFSISAGPYLVEQSVSFDGSASLDPDGSIATYSWNFGDGTSTSGSSATVSHAYATAGAHTVTLTVTDSDHMTGGVSHQLTVYSPPAAAFAVSPSAPVAGAPVSFNASSSSDPDQGVTITSYSWNFGDGASATGATPSHGYTASGSYTVILTVTNNVGLTNTTSQQVTVSPQGTTAAADEPPTATFAIRTDTPATGQKVAFDANGSLDPDGSIVSYAWNFGDGGTGVGVAPSHAYKKPGVYTVTLGVVDSAGSMALRTQTVRVVEARITRVVVTHPSTTRTMILAWVNAPGTLYGPGRHAHLSGPGTVKWKLYRPSAARMGQIKIRFVPAAGPPATRTISLGR